MEQTFILGTIRGGGVTKKMVRSLLIDAAVVVFLVPSIVTPPRPCEKRMLRDIFLIARPPLLAVMRGGEFAFLKWRLTWTAVPSRRVAAPYKEMSRYLKQGAAGRGAQAR